MDVAWGVGGCGVEVDIMLVYLCRPREGYPRRYCFSFCDLDLFRLLSCLKLVDGHSDWLGGVVANLEPLAFARRIRRDVTLFGG